jgi:hypothetical protein
VIDIPSWKRTGRAIPHRCDRPIANHAMGFRPYNLERHGRT